MRRASRFENYPILGIFCRDLLFDNPLWTQFIYKPTVAPRAGRTSISRDRRTQRGDVKLRFGHDLEIQ